MLALALLLGQLLPCEWRGVSVSCEQGCSCSEAQGRLELARSELLAHWAACPPDFDKALRGWHIWVTRKPSIPGPAGEVLYGVTVGAEHRIVLSRDMRAALHELTHVQEIALGIADQRDNIFEHRTWDKDGALREIDGRYLQRFRGQLP